MFLEQIMSTTIQGDGPVILVDDSETDRILFQLIYGRSICKNPLLLMEGGQEILNYLKEVQVGKYAIPSLILLDINMPEMNGFEVLENIRKQKAFEKMPILLMFTTSKSPEDKKKASHLGANGYQVKPFEVDRYLKFINSLSATSSQDLE
jgi:CheY-like chemotaxis protein